MKRFLMLVALGSIGLCSTSAHSQSRDLGARRLILDDGGTGRLTIEYAGPGSGTFTFPDGNSTTVAPGTMSWQTLYWDGLQWVASSALSTDGNDVAITAANTTINATNTTINSVNGTDVIGDLRISAAGSSTAAPAILGVTPWGAGNAARWEFGDAANAISSSFGGRMQMVSWWGLEIYGAAGFGAPVPSFPVGTPGDDAVTIHTVKTGTKGLTVNGIVGQTADLQNWKVNNVEVARVTASGAIDATSLTLDNALTVAEGGTGVDASSIAANLVFASPAAGAGAPSFRALVASDLPAGATTYINNGTTPQTADFNITGNGTIGNDLSVGGAIALPSTSATDGQITVGGSRFMHAYGTGATFVGTTAGNFTQTGAENTGVGLNALRSIAAGNHNTAVGGNALVSNTTGVQNTAIGRNALASVVSTGLNTAVGTAALMANTSIMNTAVGNAAAMQTSTGFNNVAVGNSALLTNVTGSNNTAIGASANVSTSNLSNATAIGANATVTASNQIMLGSGAVTNVTTSGAINTDAGFRVANAAPAGQYLRGNGTNFVAGAIQAADLPSGSGSYINNSTTPQVADFNVTGNGTIANATVSSLNVAAGTDKFAGIITTDDANGDNTETYSNSLITANSIVVVSPTSYLGMGVGILYATPSAGTLTITFNVNVSDGKQISYIIVNP